MPSKPLTRVLEYLENVTTTTDGWSARCPAHSDHMNSLSVNEGRDGRVLIYCHAGCHLDDILDPLGMSARELFVPGHGAALTTKSEGTNREPSCGLTLAEYADAKKLEPAFLDKFCLENVNYNQRPALKIPYFDVNRDECAVRFRLSMAGEKRFVWKKGDKPALYGLWRIKKWLSAGYIVLAEGESDTQTLWTHKFPALGLPGANTWREDWAGYLAKFPKIFVVIEKDRGGEAVLSWLDDSVIRERVHFVRFENVKDPSALHVKDPAKFRGAFQKALDAALPYSRKAVADVRDWLGIASSTRTNPNRDPVLTVPEWPDPPAPEAYHGLAGELVATIEPHSEAAAVALLVQLLAMFGNSVGRGPHFVAEADRHGANIFPVLVGVSSKGRKGSSLSQIKSLFQEADAAWASGCIQSGLSSGEGLIWAVRDAIERREPVKKGSRVIGYQIVISDHGVADKRLLDLETEFASVLRTLGREGNTLSATIRQAWDSGDLRILTKNSPAKASGAHISIIGHITRDELRRYLGTTEVGNGFANRFLWVCAQRSKCLPEGGRPADADLHPLINQLREALQFSKDIEVMQRSEKARALWLKVYPKLSEGHPGMLGAVTSRAESQVMRLACIYALLDRKSSILFQHLKAALALWKYCEASARYIFGGSLGDPTADSLLAAIRAGAEGLTRTQIRDHFQRNRSANDIDRALGMLMEHGLVGRRRGEQHDGRPAELWTAV